MPRQPRLASVLFFSVAWTLALACPLGAGPATNRAPGTPLDDGRPRPRIRAVHVLAEDIFPGARTLVKTFLNKAHARTALSVIRGELLFRPGDFLDSALVAESERNLRALGFLLGVRAEVVPILSADDMTGPGRGGAGPDPAAAGEVDIVVRTRDLWSMYFNFKAEGAGGEQRYNLRLGERNLFGRGQSLELELDRTSFHDSRRLLFLEPRFLGSRWNLLGTTSLFYGRAAGRGGARVGEGADLTLEYPLFSRRSELGMKTRAWTTRNLHYENEGDAVKTWSPAAGVDLPRLYEKRELGFEAEGTRSWGGETRRQLFAGFLTTVKRYGIQADVPDAWRADFIREVLPAAGTRHAFVAGARLDTFRYLKLRDHQFFGKVEDVPTGLFLEARTAVSRRWWGSDEDGVYLNGKASYTAVLPGDQLACAVVDWRVDLAPQPAGGGPSGGTRNGEVRLRYAHFARALPLGQFAGRFEARFGGRLDQDSLYQLGGTSGLRGYPSNRFSGDRLLLGNFEYRFGPFQLDVIRFSVVTFYDVGTAWRRAERPLAGVPFHPAAGLGLRFALPALNPNLFRFDLGWGLGGPGDRATLVSFGYNQVF